MAHWTSLPYSSGATRTSSLKAQRNASGPLKLSTRAAHQELQIPTLRDDTTPMT